MKQTRFLITARRHAPTLGALSLCGALLSGCGPKEVAVPSDTTVVVQSPTPAPGKVTVDVPPVVVKPAATPKTKIVTKVVTKEVTPTPAKSGKDDSVKLPPPAATPTKAPTKAPAKTVGKLGPIPKDATTLVKEDIKVGTGAIAEAGKTVSVHYTGTLTDGKKFDSSLERGQPFNFPLGQGAVIPGWDEGVAGMKVGGKRRLIIPPDLGYGDRGAGADIPPGATLVFTVELLGVE